MILSRRNPRIAELARLHRARHRRLSGRTLLEGPHLLSEALASDGEVLEVLALPEDAATRRLCEQRGIPLTAVSREALGRIADTKTPRGPVAVLSIPRKRPGGGDTLWIMVSEPGNAGTLIRTAAAFGWDVATGPGTVDPWAPKVLRAGAGGHFRVAMEQVEEPPPEAMVLAAVPRSGVPLAHLGPLLDHSRQWWLIVGEESRGISPGHAERVDLWCTVPMSGGTESLNAAAAGAIICHRLWELRACAGNRFSRT
ncbi:MAG: RNA methyltransferase [bacterium]|nr:RNA methyltransferase [bacterium]MDE0601822.1 RNA methyltransferase [bacterium]